MLVMLYEVIEGPNGSPAPAAYVIRTGKTKKAKRKENFPKHAGALPQPICRNFGFREKIKSVYDTVL
jgi:hypothetical protein